MDIDPLLIEIDHGTWQGRYREEIARSEPELYYEWREHPEGVRFAGGESLEDVLDRWKAFVTAFSANVDTLLMTHDVVVRIAVLERTGRPISELRTVRALNAAYAEFDVANGDWDLVQDCVDGHLAEFSADLGRQAL